jgi:hypothetical protein
VLRLDRPLNEQQHVAMELVWAATLWGLWSCWLVSQHVDVPRSVTRVSAGLLATELVTLAVHSFGCGDGGCGPAGQAAGTAASLDVPVLSALFVAVTISQAWRSAHRAANVEPRRDGNARRAP